MNTNKINLLDISIILAKKKRMIFLITLISSISAVIFSLLVNQKWTSTAIVQPLTTTNSFDISNIGGSLLGGLSSSLGIGDANVEGERLVAIIYSRPFLEKVIQRFNLTAYFKIKIKNKTTKEEIRDLTLKYIKEKMLKVTFNEKVGFLEISITSKDKYFSAEIANFIVNEIDYFNKHERITKAKEKRILLENRVILLDNEIKQIQNDYTDFQKSNNVLSIEDQTKSIIEQYVLLESDKIKKQITLDLLSVNFDLNDPRILNKKDEVNVLKNTIKKIENSNQYSKYILSLDNVADYTKKYIQVETQLKINYAVLEFIYPQLELAKLEESKESTTLDIIEDAVPAGKRTWPKRALLCITVFFLSLLFSIAFALVSHYLENLIHLDDNHEKLNMLKKELFKL